jgi:hypothetical protein
MSWKRYVIVTGLLFAAGPAWSQESITYSYDSKGRLVKTERSGTTNNDVTTYSYDKADNRSRLTTTGAPPSDPATLRLVSQTAGNYFDEGQSFTIALNTENVAGKELILRIYTANTGSNPADWTETITTTIIQAATAAGCQTSTRQSAGYDAAAGFITPGTGGSKGVVIRFPPGSYNDANPITFTVTARADGLTEAALEQIDFLIDRFSGVDNLVVSAKAVSKWIRDTSKSST